MPCSPNDVSIDIPDGPSGPSIPNFGTPFSLKAPKINMPAGFPEDLLDLLNKLKMLIPPGALQSPLSVNWGKDIFDSIMKLLDQFMPYLMMYKFFLPLLKMILCIIEVLCSLKNPFKLVKALKKLFRKCLPDFLNLFPLFALIIMIISLLMLLLALIKYIIEQIKRLVELILRNIRALQKAIDNANDNSIIAIAKKIGASLCIFQNFFVLLTIFAILFDIIREILTLIFSIPPCDDSDVTDEDACCTPDVCPNIIKYDYVRKTGFLQYYNTINRTVANNSISQSVRNESWQLYDPNQSIQEAFSNIIDAYDVTQNPKPVFFPTDGTYTHTTPPKQSPYLIDLRLFYNPADFNRGGGPSKWIRFNNCIVSKATTRQLLGATNSVSNVEKGVLLLLGGQGFEDDNVTILTGFNDTKQASLLTFLHKEEENFPDPEDIIYSNGTLFNSVEYTFKPNKEILVSKDLVTAGCMPTFRQDYNAISEWVGNYSDKTDALKKAMDTAPTLDPETKQKITFKVNSYFKDKNMYVDPSLIEQGFNDFNKTGGFPDPAATQESMMTAISALRNDLTESGVNQFEKTCLTALNKLSADASKALENMIKIGTDVSKSNFSIFPKVQFTSRPIEVSVNLKERYGKPIAVEITPEIASNLSVLIKPHMNFGKISNFIYDGYQSFKANITSNVAGTGQLKIEFNSNMLNAINIPTNTAETPTNTIQYLDYQFIYTPTQVGTTDATTITATSVNTTDLEKIAADEAAINAEQAYINNAASVIIAEVMAVTTATDTTTQPRRDDSDSSVLGDNLGSKDRS
jgi:hypothetical protein